MSRCKNLDHKKLNKIAVIEAIRDNIFYNIFVYIISFFLSLRIQKIIIVKDDGFLKHYDTNKFYHKKNKSRENISFTKIHWGFLNSLKQKNVEILNYSQILKLNSNSKEFLDKITYVDKNSIKTKISKHVEASHKRFYGGRKLDLENKNHTRYTCESIFNEELNNYIAKIILEKINPDLYITLDGIYTTYGVTVEVMKKHNVPVLIYQMCQFQDRTIFIGHEHVSVFNISNHYKRFLNSDKKINNEKKANEYLKSRTTGRIIKIATEENIELISA